MTAPRSTRTTRPACRAARRAARARRWRPAWSPPRSAPTPTARSACPPPSAACSGSSRPSAGCRGQAAFPSAPASTISARWRARRTTWRSSSTRCRRDDPARPGAGAAPPFSTRPAQLDKGIDGLADRGRRRLFPRARRAGGLRRGRSRCRGARRDARGRRSRKRRGRAAPPISSPPRNPRRSISAASARAPPTSTRTCATA